VIKSRKNEIGGTCSANGGEEREIGGTCSANGGEERRIQDIGWDTCEKETPLGDPAVDRRTVLRWIFRKWDVGVWNGSSRLRIGTVGGHM